MVVKGADAKYITQVTKNGFEIIQQVLGLSDPRESSPTSGYTTKNALLVAIDFENLSNSKQAHNYEVGLAVFDPQKPDIIQTYDFVIGSPEYYAKAESKIPIR